MRILDRYFTREFLKTYLLVFAAFSVVFIVIDVIDNLSPLMRSGTSFQDVILYYALRLPYLIVLSSPLTILVTGMFMMNNLSKHNESVAVRAAGISIKRALFPLFVLGAIISIIIAVFGEYVLPLAEKNRAHLYDTQIRSASPEPPEDRARLHFQTEKGEFFHIAFFDGSQNIIRGLDICQPDSTFSGIKRRIVAPTATWKDDSWVLGETKLWGFTGKKDIDYQAPPPNANKLLDLKPQNFAKAGKKSLDLGFFELREHIAGLKKTGEKANREILDLHLKLAFPLTNLIAVFFFVPIATSNIRSRGRGLLFALALALGFTQLILLRMAQSLGYAGVIDPVWAAWAPNILFSALGIFLLMRAEA